MILPNHKLHHWMHKCIFKTCFTTLLRVERRSCSSKKCFIGSNFCFVKAVENKSGSSELLLYVSLKYLINIRKRKKLVKYQNCIIFSPTAQRAKLSKLIFWLTLLTLATMQSAQGTKKIGLASLTHCWACIFIWYSRVKSWSLDCSSKVAWIQKFNTIFRFINFSVIWVQWIIRRSSKSFVSYTHWSNGWFFVLHQLSRFLVQIPFRIRFLFRICPMIKSRFDFLFQDPIGSRTKFQILVQCVIC